MKVKKRTDFEIRYDLKIRGIGQVVKGKKGPDFEIGLNLEIRAK